VYLRNNRIGILDLASGEVSEQDLPDDTDLERLSSVRIADGLAREHGGDSLVLGTGILTASFVPAACAGIVRSARGVMPVLGFAGVELKLSGFDFVVLKGEAAKPGYVWIRDGVMELVEAEAMKSLDSWGRIDRIRANQGDNKIQVLAGGPWCDAKSPATQIVTDYWGGEDKSGIGAELGRMNLLGIAFRGMGELELQEPEGHFEESILLMREQVARLGANEGLASYSSSARREDFKALVHRHVACYGCPFPCRSFLKIHEPAQEFRLVAKEPGYLHYDIPALEKALELGLDARAATDVFIKCARAGVEPVAALARASETSQKVTSESVAAVVSGVRDIRTSATRGNFEASFPDRSTYIECLGLGLCPRYWSKAGFDKDVVARLANSALGIGT